MIDEYPPAVDDLARELHDAVHGFMTHQVEVTGGWPTDVERLVWQSLDIALALFLAHLAALDPNVPEPVQ